MYYVRTNGRPAMCCDMLEGYNSAVLAFTNRRYMRVQTVASVMDTYLLVLLPNNYPARPLTKRRW
jgi:hypothetical protein